MPGRYQPAGGMSTRECSRAVPRWIDVRSFVLVMLVGCGTAPVIHATTAVPTDAVEAIAPVGAVPVPDDAVAPALEEVDTTVTSRPVLVGEWRRDVAIVHAGRQLVALQARDGELVLTLVEDDAGITSEYVLGAATGIVRLSGEDGNTFAPRDRVGEYQGPILFAVRIRAANAAPWHQLVVATDGAALEVTSRPLGTAAWTGLLRVMLAPGTTYVAIGTTDPH